MTGNIVRVAENAGSFAFGAGYAVFAKTTIDHSTISGNRADAPRGTARGALANASPEGITVTDTVISRNATSAPGGTATGGGVANNSPLDMISTRVLDNTATAAGGVARGGGIRNGPFGTRALKSSAVRGNLAKAVDGGTAQGGGIFHAAGTQATGSTVLNDSFVTANKADDGGGIFTASGTVTLNNTVVQRNRAEQLRPPKSVPGCTG
ncbi:hypothetical protein [Streptomyces echinatus]|uniref:Uncharacterized protein n=1 Tax=Streptomyces echinatus TaxID=67293 RepID=A0A7W9PNB1_9ACTN|nr:hypothetical protein [Streptomyces echinatus]MBB5924893.1 hypothetical protein [Streptomyces echinatus]